MRFAQVTISGFGGVAGDLTVDLDSDVVLFVGANGFGKTTICDAIAWALTGVHPRGADPRSVYSRSGETHVALEIRGSGETPGWTVRRSVANPESARNEKLQTHVFVASEKENLRGPSAEIWMMQQLMYATEGEDPASLASTFIQSYYMQQESLREFLSKRSDDERFTGLSRMVGTGALSDFVREFETVKTAWVRATNKSDVDLGPQRGRLAALKESKNQLEQELRAAEAQAVHAGWAAWWSRVREVIVGETRDLPPLSVTVLDAALSGLRVALLKCQQRGDDLAALRSQLAVPLTAGPVDEEIARLQGEVSQQEESHQAAQRHFEDARMNVDKIRAEMRLRADLRRDLVALAELALRHVGDHCPTCGQGVQPSELEDRLRAIVLGAEGEEESPELPQALAASRSCEFSLEESRRNLVISHDKLDSALSARAAADVLMARRTERLKLAGLLAQGQAVEADPEGVIAAVDALISESSEEFGRIASLLEESQTLQSATRITRSAQKLTSVASEVLQAQADLDAAETDLASRKFTSERADTLLHAFRTDAEEFVGARLEALQPVLDQLYAAVDPHPTFRSVRLAIRTRYGKQRLDPVLSDAEEDISVQDPDKTLSTSQANALAVALFLSFNLGLAPCKLDTMVLDDPLQNLDDAHLLGLVDMLRRVIPYRQLLLTTHDEAFATLLSRKLRPISASQKALLVKIVKWDRLGPEIVVENIPGDLQPMKIAVAV